MSQSVNTNLAIKRTTDAKTSLHRPATAGGNFLKIHSSVNLRQTVDLYSNYFTELYLLARRFTIDIKFEKAMATKGIFLNNGAFAHP